MDAVSDAFGLITLSIEESEGNGKHGAEVHRCMTHNAVGDVPHASQAKILGNLRAGPVQS